MSIYIRKPDLLAHTVRIFRSHVASGHWVIHKRMLKGSWETEEQIREAYPKVYMVKFISEEWAMPESTGIEYRKSKHLYHVGEGKGAMARAYRSKCGDTVWVDDKYSSLFKIERLERQKPGVLLHGKDNDDYGLIAAGGWILVARIVEDMGVPKYRGIDMPRYAEIGTPEEAQLSLIQP